MANEIEKKFGVKPHLIKSGGGVFEVIVDGHKIFSKRESGRFPDHDEILASMSAGK